MVKGCGKVFPLLQYGPRLEEMCYSVFLMLALYREVSGQIGGYVGRRPGLDAVAKVKASMIA
jgi:hypothetical protein